ncbi:tyrosine-type recombinase/integrase [Clostridium sp. AL.422]|uniref:tyrosine-type recombinase/integrase n=1 Tax=Clostridium TaxID=1485 RepID=UPI00293DB1B4|nr:MULTISPECIES: tyrosine-type recombinase/integrase [unclassified Clostridium]MDV4152728.1 tyrosine-type recombinase/integrase [Clostridium sp. AL.422]
MSAEHKNLKDTVADISEFIKKEHPEMWRKQLDQIPSEVFDEYLATKKDCSQNTIAAYKSRVEKAFRCAAATYKNGDFEAFQYINTPLSNRTEDLRNVSIGRDLLNIALKHMDPNSGGFKGNKIASLFGARIFEIEKLEVRDINFKDNTLTIRKGKGNKTRVIKMTDNQAAIMANMVKDMKPSQRIAGCGQDAIQKSLIRALERIDKKYETNTATQLTDKKTNTHAIRKLVATEQYNKNLNYEKYKYILSKLETDYLKTKEAGITKEILEKYKVDITKIDENKLATFCRKNFNDLENTIENKDIRMLEHTAWSPVSEMLGHGPNRWELKDVYVVNDSTKIINIDINLLFQ